MKTLKGKLKWPFKDKAQLGEDYLMLKPEKFRTRHRELESQRIESHQANQLADQAQREK